ncbi:MAG: ATP-binding cassette domain-containing protein [Verrucomicrobia bacterium]|nr:ATP-binding cassette domain-containing protein [Verrucomicrobiota bacterium]
MLLSASELTLVYGYQRLLEGATLAAEPGEKVGLVGRNGCGKTSLLRILSGELAPDSGEVSRRRGLRVSTLPQEFELNDDRTVRENIESGAADLVEWMRRYERGDGSESELAELAHAIDAADGWNLNARLEAEASVLGVPPLDTLVAPLSGGEKRRVALCRALVGQPDLLLLDEPTNHLDVESIRWLEGFLRGFPGAVIFVTHDRYFLDVIATRIVELADGRCFSHPGNYTAYLESKAIRQQIADQSERRRQRYLRVELDWVRAGVRAQRSKAKHRLDTFYGVAGLEAPPEEREMDLLIPPAPEMGNTAVDLVSAGAKVGEGEQERWLFRFLDLSLKPGQCTGVVGRNGVGKTTLLRICMGERPPDEGRINLGRKLRFNYIDQGRMQLNDTGTVLNQVADEGDTVRFGDRVISARAYLRRFLFAEERVKEPVSRLSGGERARLMLAKVLKRGGNLLVLDEPTNDLDLPSLRLLEEALVDFEGSVLVVSHDRYFLDRICDQIVAFEESGVFVQPGNFSYYLEKKLERDERQKARETVSRPAAKEIPRDRAQRPRKLTFKEQRELEGMETAILEAETRVHELEVTLNDPAFYANRAIDAPRLIVELEAARAEAARLYARWQELDSIGK